MTASRPTIVRDLPISGSAAHRVAIIDSHGVIIAVNDAWTAFAEEAGAGTSRVGPGANYFEVCRRASGSHVEAREALSGIQSVLKGRIPSFTMDYSCLTPSGSQAYFRMDATPIHYVERQVVIAHTDVTELQISKDRSLALFRHFARRLINAQEEERHRISRELHDDLGNRIALLAFSVRRVMNHRSRNSSAQGLNQVIEEITELSNALRTLTHCLHPPLMTPRGGPRYDRKT